MTLYFMRKLWVELIMDKHVNYFGIGHFHGVGLGSSQNQENSRHDPELGPLPNILLLQRT
jgi:hypothetical protein